MPERSHLSIGEVLSLLREEFPDVTISKIRFLESQGLVDPERTPSGYRKFYEHDVERLRWILRQQREHFLPLKVIRGRLSEHPAGSEAGSLEAESAVWGLDEPPPEDEVSYAHAVAGHDAEAAHRARPATEGGGTPGGGTPGGGATGGGTPGSGVGGTATSGGGTTAGGASTGPGAAARGGSRPAGVDTGLPAPGGVPATAGPAGAADQVEAPGDGSGDGEQTSGPEHAGASGRPTPSSAAEATATTRAAARPALGRRAPTTSSPDDTAASLDADELAAATGATPALVTDLQRYGLIGPHAVVGGTPYFDGYAVAVTRAAVGLSRYGVEPRHLRGWRNAADREVGLFEQVIMPLLRQRNPQARKEAADTLAELAGLGASLRAALVAHGLSELH